jgi:hypothetical protein
MNERLEEIERKDREEFERVFHSEINGLPKFPVYPELKKYPEIVYNSPYAKARDCVVSQSF